MANYEELYNSAKHNYEEAISERNSIRQKSSELNGRKDELNRELDEKRNALSDIKQKLAIVRDAYDKCNNILNNEFPDMKKALLDTGTEYKKIITSDKGVADLSSIYSTDLTNTKGNLDNISADLGKSISDLEDKETNAQREVDNCSSELEGVKSQLNNLGSEYSAQIRADIYYAEMKEYERKWLDGE